MMETLTLGYIDSRQAHFSSKRSSQASIQHRHNKKQRDRLIILFVVFVIGLGFGMVFDGSAAAASSTTYAENIAVKNESLLTDSDKQFVTYEVQSGDTLWRIAKQHKPGHMHIHTYIDQLKQLNGITDSLLYEGMLLNLP